MGDIHQRIYRIKIFPLAGQFIGLEQTDVIAKVKEGKHLNAQIGIHLSHHLHRIRRMDLHILPH